jgi:serine phosphatase RsbU (regulator of sigma subunit)/anti-sigma regulatory factor (Ser/Thr protein kinase)/transposase
MQIPRPLIKFFMGRLLKRFELKVLAKEQHLGEIRDFITSVATEAGFSLHEVNNLKLALDEACSNVVRHAYKGREPGTITLTIFWRERALDIRIFDQGKGFDWKGTRAPDLNRYVEIGKKGGLGIWFIRKLMDLAEYRSNARGNTLRLVKVIKTPRPQPAPETALLPAEPGLFPGTPLKQRSMSVKIKYLVPVVSSVAILVLIIFLYMFRNQSASMRAEIISNEHENLRRMAVEAVNYLLKQDDLQLTSLVKGALKTDDKLGYAFVVNTEGVILAHSTTQQVFKTFQPPAGYQPPDPGKIRVVVREDPGAGKIYDLVTGIAIDSVRLGTLHIGLKESAILEEIQTGYRHAVTIFIISLVASTTGAYLFMTLLVAPVQKLAEGMLAISAGRLNHRIMIRSNDEFGQIAQIFNEMTKRFGEAQSHLLEQERIQQEMQVAQEIQHTLLPREVPQIEGYDVASLYRSAKEVGGDYFDFVLVDDNVMGVAVADVSGKGVPGSLVMTMIRTALRLEARGNRSARTVMAKVNDFMTPDMKKGMFVTMFYIVLDSRQRTINFSCAGHNPLVLYREETDRVYYLKPRGFPLGIDLPDPALFAKSLTQEQVRLKKGDLLMAYTDGITEAMNHQRQQYGEQRLIAFIRANHNLSSNEFVDKLSADLAGFTGDYPQNDDITCVVIKEKLVAEAVQVNLRRKLFYLVDKEGFSVAEACRQLKVSTTTYYRLKRIRDTFGTRRLLTVHAQTTQAMQQLSLEERAVLLGWVVREPAWGAKRLAQALASTDDGKPKLSEKSVALELKRLRLNTAAERKAYAAKKKVDEASKAVIPS